MKRREFIGLVGGVAAAWPLAARAQTPKMPVVGHLSINSAIGNPQQEVAFRQGLKEGGFVEGQNVAIESRWAEGQYDRLPALATDLVRRQVAVIFVGGDPSIAAAKAATATIPIVFETAGDPVQLGFVANFNRPGSNLTGVSMYNAELGSKRLELLLAMVPKATAIAYLMNPAGTSPEQQLRDMQAAAHALGRSLLVLKAASPSEIDAAFAALAQQRPDALVVAPDGYLSARREQIVPLVAQLGIASIHSPRVWVVSGALMSYGTDTDDSYRQAGVYVSRILKGEKPADLPVVQPTKFELVINLKTAKTLGLEVPPNLLALADEVIE
jgi:putative ABC transport system substrate-binding protein